jgi:hypothetical protein
MKYLPDFYGAVAGGRDDDLIAREEGDTGNAVVVPAERLEALVSLLELPELETEVRGARHQHLHSRRARKSSSISQGKDSRDRCI